MPPKRKRNDRVSEAGGNRPAPHRPSDTNLGQHDRDPQNNRRGSGGGRNFRRNSDRRESYSNNQTPVSPTLPRPSSSSSQAATAPPPFPPPPPSNIPPAAPVLRASITSNYNYVVLTEARLSTWEQTGRQEVVEHGVTSRSDEDIEELSTISQEFTRAVIESRLHPREAGSCMKQILGEAPGEDDGEGFGYDAPSLFLDIISVFFDSEDDLIMSQLREFLAAVELPPSLLRKVLDSTTLEKLGLIRETFTRLGIRYATNVLYRQANYNLLREESEGFSKLATELYPEDETTRSAPTHIIETTWEHVKGLIGTFDLDVGRVLDVLLDAFAATMIRNLRFFTRLLRTSSWWPSSRIPHFDEGTIGGLPRWALLDRATAEITEEDEFQLASYREQRDLAFWARAREVHLDAFYELGGRQPDSTELDAASRAASKPSLVDKWISETKTLPPSGNRVAAQLLGFKLRFYASKAREADDVLPANLLFLTAYLIRIGFISLTDLYPHLWPSDENMEATREQRMLELEEKERQDRQGNEPNALLKAGALPDDTVPIPVSGRETSTAKAEASQQDTKPAKAAADDGLPEPENVIKADLVGHMLTAGAIPEALFILGRFPWLTEAYPVEILGPLHRILLHSIDKVYQEARPALVADPITTSVFKQQLAQDQSGLPKGDIRLRDPTQPKTLKWPHADAVNRGTSYRYYLDEWADNVPVCQTVDDIFTLCGTFLNISGVNIGREHLLLKKLAVIGAKSLLEDQSPENLSRWQDLLRRILVPALSYTDANVDVVNAVWDLLKHYPSDVRYNIYAECYEGSISRLPAMRKAFKNARSGTLGILKRLSATNIPSTAKQLAKVALPSPGIVCKVALAQIEAYTNLIEAFVECTRYFTDFGYDVLVWSLMSSVGGKQRSRTQEGSVLLTSKWLQALSRFSGKVFRRYANMDPSPLVQYVNDQLAHGNSTDLVILRELITSMGGIVSDIDFTDQQLSALSGGEALRKQTLINLGDQRFESTKSASRFIEALVSTSLGSRLLINLAQYRQTAIYRLPEDETHIKYLATVVDDTQQALVQYIEMLRSNLPPEQFDALVPDIPTLLTEYGLDTTFAFMIGRASLSYYMTGPGVVIAKHERASQHEAPAAVDMDGDISMDAKDTTPSSQVIDTTAAADGQSALDMPDAKEKAVDLPSATNGRAANRFLDVLQPIIDTVQTTLPPEVWTKISREFYVLFWSLQTGDLAVPVSSYSSESIRVKNEHDKVKRDRSDMSRKGVDEREQKKAELSQLNAKLANEVSECQEKTQKTRLMLNRQSGSWLLTSMAKSHAVADILIEECLGPRIFLSAGDADFSHKMVKFLHENSVANFKITSLYDRLFNVNRLRSMIFDCTLREAEFLGRFIKLTLADLSRWHRSKDTFEKEAVGLHKKTKSIAFATTLDEDGQPTAFMDHGQFRGLLWTWHNNLAKALKTCLEGTEWMHIRNAITVLKSSLEYFPAVTFHGKQFMQALTTIGTREAASKGESDDAQGHRVDLSVAANTAASALKRYETKWVIVQDFRPSAVGDPQEEKKAAAPTKGGLASSLRAGAPEFKPQQSPDDSAPRPKAAAEVEDGEVKDTKTQKPGTEASSIKTAAQNALDGTSRRDSVSTTAAGARQDSGGLSSSRPSTPKPAGSVSSPASQTRGDTGKAPNMAPGSSSKMHGLPSRPDVPFPSHFTHDKYGHIHSSEARQSREGRDVREPRDPRETREPREPRDSREPREPREPRDSARATRTREHAAGDRRSTDDAPRDTSRPDRERPSQRDETHPRRGELNAQDRDGRYPSRERQIPPTNSSRSQQEPLASTKPADSQSQPDGQGPTVNPERARLIQGDRPEPRQDAPNSSRPSHLSDARPPHRQGRDDSRDRNAPRPDSRLQDPVREDRPGRGYRSDNAMNPRDHRGEGRPTGSRGDRDFDRDVRSANERSRDPGLAQGPPSQPRGDSDHGRLKQDPDYGRLPAAPDMGQVPDGPRGRGRNSNHPSAPTGPNSRPDARLPISEPGRPPTPTEKHQPPTGPASSRQRRGQGGQFGHNNSAPNTPASHGSPSVGVHPDRLRHISSGGAGSSPGQVQLPASSSNSIPVHPDRLSHLNSPSAPAHGSGGPGRSSLPPLQTPDRQSGLPNNRQPLGVPVTPTNDNASMPAPTGPAASNERVRTGDRRRLAGINNVLQTAGLSGSENPTRAPSVRSRPSRSNLAGSDAQVLTGASPVSTPVHDRADPMGGDRFGDPSQPRNGVSTDERPPRNDRDRGRREQDPSERSSRPSRRPSRERSPDRERGPKDHRDYRERPAGAPRDAERDPTRRLGRDPSGPIREPQVPMGGRGEPMGMNSREGGRDPRHRGEGGGGRHEDYIRTGGGRGAGNMGGPPRGVDERRDSRRGPGGGVGGDDRGQKRRSDDFGGQVEGGREKRPRR